MKPAGSTAPVFPFTALVGQEKMKLALLLVSIHPQIGGLLIRGQKGTAKSTAVRGLAAMMASLSEPRRSILVELPLGATEEMVVGTIDFEAALREGKSFFLPGLLHRAHEGMLYVDEANLLDDHLVDCILDATESGVNYIEREGLSIRHPSRFALVGSMNPEEGELRPQLLDRFGLAVEVEGDADIENRVMLMRRRESFDRDQAAFILAFQEADRQSAERIAYAKQRVSEVTVPSHLLGFIAEICTVNNTAGHRADLAMERAARALAAWRGRDEVTFEDIQTVAPMALLHRTRQSAPPDLSPPPPPDNDKDSKDRETNPPPLDKSDTAKREPKNDAPSSSNTENQSSDTDDRNSAPPPTDKSETSEDSPEEKVWEVGRTYRVRSIVSEKDKRLRTGSGRRSRSRSGNKHGRYIRSTAKRRNDDIALDATLRAAAPFQVARRKASEQKLAVHIFESDIREKIRERRMGNVLIFAVDGSGSMGANRRMAETKGAVMSLLMDAYQKRDKVSMVVFRGREATIVLPPTGSVHLASRLLTDLPIGGRTPLSAGLCRVETVLSQVKRKDPFVKPIVIFITDGKANAAMGDTPAHLEALSMAAALSQKFEDTRFIVVDTEPKGAVRLELAKDLAVALSADYFEPEELRANELIDIIKENY
jgi:magnesium chelatase subunit D